MNLDVLFLFLLILFCNKKRVSCTISVLLNSKQVRGKPRPLKAIIYCKDCPSVEDQGSILYALEAKNGIKAYHVSGGLVYTIPNLGQKRNVMNSHELVDNVALVDRGEVPILDKILKIQKTGAVALVIVDDGQCDEDFLHCGHRIGSVREGGFGAYDSKELWREVTIPVLMVTRSTGEKLRGMMDIQRMEIPGLGWQNVSHFPIGDDEL